MSSIKHTSTRTNLRKEGIADSRPNSVNRQIKNQKKRRARGAKVRSITVPIPVLRSLDIRCELDKFYEEVNAMQQQFGQQQQSTNTFGLGGGRRKRRSSKLKRRNN